MTLREYFEADFATDSRLHQQQTKLKAWRRACIETLTDRSIDFARIAHNRSANRYKIVRYMPYWMAVPVDQIHDALEAIEARFAEAFR